MLIEEERATGITLESKPFEEFHKIATIFTFEQGLIKLFVQNAHKKNLPIQPYCKVELVYKKGKSGLDYYKDGRLLKMLPNISSQNPQRGLLEINIANQMAKIVLSSQCTKSPAQNLYLLFEAYLTTLPLVSNPENLLRSFQLKLLIYEGVILIENRCRTCNELLDNSYYCSGEPFCETHITQDPIHFSPEESQNLFNLALSRSIHEVDEAILDENFSKKLECFFEFLRIK
ncbi:MAG: DNA repair protein RecO [Chlamydiales bacterium]|nr:DNA repair protein RecO [Chlamydiales bacterium]